MSLSVSLPVSVSVLADVISIHDIHERVLSERKTIISVFKLLFLADSGGEEQGDGLLG